MGCHVQRQEADDRRVPRRAAGATCCNIAPACCIHSIARRRRRLSLVDHCAVAQDGQDPRGALRWSRECVAVERHVYPRVPHVTRGHVSAAGTRTNDSSARYGQSALRYTTGLASSDKSVPSDLAGRKCATRTDVRCGQPVDRQHWQIVHACWL